MTTQKMVLVPLEKYERMRRVVSATTTTTSSAIDQKTIKHPYQPLSAYIRVYVYIFVNVKFILNRVVVRNSRC